MRIINKKYLLIILLVGVILTGFIVLKPNKKVQLDNVILKQEVNNKTFAMYTETDSGYEEYEGNKFPSGYRLNQEKSKCIDNNGAEINNALKEENGNISLTTNKSSYCYLYFDEKENLSNICNDSTMHDCMSNNRETITTMENLSTVLKGNMYRYQGLATDVDNNYICFGTNNKENCINDTDHYMYRIIGIEESGRIKVIKKEALNNAYQWLTNDLEDVKLPNSIPFQKINGDDFLNNPSYIPAEWKDKISENTWIYGDMDDDYPNGAKQMGNGLYETETGKKETRWYVKSTVEDAETEYKEQQGIWTDTINSKISLMYLHDYSYSVGDEAKCNYSYGEEEFSKCKLGWIFLSNNDNQAPSDDEWTMVRNGWHLFHKVFGGFNVHVDGCTGAGEFLTSSFSIRPVFYIDSNQIIESGLGTLENPFIIKS